MIFYRPLPALSSLLLLLLAQAVPTQVMSWNNGALDQINRDNADFYEAQRRREQKLEEEFQRSRKFLFEEDDGDNSGMSERSTPKRITRVQERPVQQPSYPSQSWDDVDNCSGLLGTTVMSPECVGEAEYQRYQRQIHGDDY